ncbi:MAG: hypothetical protein AAF288_04990 [Planctomycetota bacterium]
MRVFRPSRFAGPRRAVGAGVLALAVLGAAGVALGQEEEQDESAPESAPQTAATQGAAPADAWAPPPVDQTLVDEIARGRLFMDQPPLPPPAPVVETPEDDADPPPPPPPPGDPDRELVLQGVMIIEGEATAFIDDREAGVVRVRRAGEPVGRGVLESVDVVGMVYRVDGVARQIPVGAALAEGAPAEEPENEPENDSDPAPEPAPQTDAAQEQAGAPERAAQASQEAPREGQRRWQRPQSTESQAEGARARPDNAERPRGRRPDAADRRNDSG